MHAHSKIASHGVATAASGVIAAGVAVLINMWTNGWAWPSGAGLCALVVCQAAFEWYRATADEGKVIASRRRLVVEQCCSTLRDSGLTGTIRLPADGDVEIRQRLGYVDRAMIIGVGGEHT